MLFNWKERNWVELTKIRAGWVNWTRDSKYLYFIALFDENNPIYRVRLSDHLLEKVTSLHGIRQPLGIGGRWMGLTPEGSPLVVRDVGTHEIYALDLEFPD